MNNVSMVENPKLQEVKYPLMKLNDKVTIVSDDGEGIVFDLTTRRTFWVNGSAAFLLELLEENSEGISLSSATKAVYSHYIISEEKDVFSDIISFFGQLEKYELFSCSAVSGTNGIRFFNSELQKPYIRPIIKEESVCKHCQSTSFFSSEYFETN